MSTYERNANRLTVVLFTALTLVSVAGAIWLPGSTPIHYNFRGQPDRWGSSTTLLILPLLCGCLIGLLWAIVRYTPTRLMNIPGPRTPENLARQRQNFDQLFATFQVLITGLFLGIAGQSCWISMHQQKQAIMWPSILFIASFCICALVYLIRAYKLVPRQ